MAVRNPRAGFVVAGKPASLDSGAGPDRKLLFGLLPAEIRSHAAGAVAGDFCFRSVGVEEPACLHIRIRRGGQPLHAVRSHAVMAVADAPAEVRDVHGNISAIDNQEVIAAGIGLNKGYDSSGRRHSGCTGPRAVTLSSNGGLLQGLQRLFLLLVRPFEIKLETDMLAGFGNENVVHHGVDRLQRAIHFRLDIIRGLAR